MGTAKRSTDQADRRALARTVRKRLAGLGVPVATLARGAGLSYATLRVALSDRAAHRSPSLPAYLPKLADAMDAKADELRRVAEELRSLGASPTGDKKRHEKG